MSQLPETILQFGTGRFLRAFVDRFVQNANDQGQKVGRIVVVQSTGGERAGLLSNQGGGYHVLVRGFQEGEVVERLEKIESLSRALIASEQWADVLAFAKSPDLKYIVSNATESGYVLDPKDTLEASPSGSLPGKLVQVLWARFQAGGKPLTLLPCELIERNAEKLIELVVSQAQAWKLPADFSYWVRNECLWLNSLVDCIVTRGPEDHPLMAKDPMLICAEPYHLWAIEKPKGKDVNLFTHPAINLCDDLSPFFLRKVRILNGTHSCMVGKFLGKFETVAEILNDKSAARWIRDVMFEEIVPVLAYRMDLVSSFADETYDRYRNPFSKHRLSDIAVGHADKVKVRLQPTKQEYEKLFGKSPAKIDEVLSRKV